MTDEYVYHLKELASTPTENFCTFSVVNRAHAYALKIQNDVKWAEEVLIGEGDDSSEFLHLLTKHLLTLSPISNSSYNFSPARKPVYLISISPSG